MFFLCFLHARVRGYCRRPLRWISFPFLSFTWIRKRHRTLVASSEWVKYQIWGELSP